jgi:hypothetical protein
MLEQIEDRLNEVPEDLRQGPVIFAAAALVGPFVLVLLAGVAGSSLSSPLLTLAAVVFVGAVIGFALTTFRRFRVQQAENMRLEAARSRRRIDRRRAASTTDATDQRRAS